jgi:hypothetical protein
VPDPECPESAAETNGLHVASMTKGAYRGLTCASDLGGASRPGPGWRARVAQTVTRRRG